LREKAARELTKLSRLEKLGEYTFESFSPKGKDRLGEEQRASLENALHTSQQFSEELNGWLLLRGGYGSGKTHLATAIANARIGKGTATLYLTAPDLLDMLRGSYSDGSIAFDDLFERVRNVDLLVVDDLGTENDTPWAQEKLFQILDHRYVNKRPTVITTNLPMDEIEPRIRSRLLDGRLVKSIDINAPDYRLPKDLGYYAGLSSLGDHEGQTFGSFDSRHSENLEPEVQKSISESLGKALAFAQDPKGWIIFTGGHSSGKTHLAAAVANFLQSEGRPALFVVLADLMDHLRATFNPASLVRFDRTFEDVRSAPLLVLDDLQTQGMSPWVREKLYQLVDHRYNARLATVITTSLKLEELDDRLRTRVEDRRLAVQAALGAPPYQGHGPKSGKPRTHPAAEKRRTSKPR